MFAINWIRWNLNGDGEEDKEWFREEKNGFLKRFIHSPMYLMPISRQLVNHQIDSKSPFNSHRNLAMPKNTYLWVATLRSSVCFFTIRARSNKLMFVFSVEGEGRKANPTLDEESSPKLITTLEMKLVLSAACLLADAVGITLSEKRFFVLFNFISFLFSFGKRKTLKYLKFTWNTLQHDNMKRADGDEETFRFRELKMSLELLMTVREEQQHEMELLRCKFCLSTVVAREPSVEGKGKEKEAIKRNFFGRVESGSSGKVFQNVKKMRAMITECNKWSSMTMPPQLSKSTADRSPASFALINLLIIFANIFIATSTTREQFCCWGKKWKCN